jgi:hypothetical protein
MSEKLTREELERIEAWARPGSSRRIVRADAQKMAVWIREKDKAFREIEEQSGAGLIVYRDAAAARFLRPIAAIARAHRLGERA